MTETATIAPQTEDEWPWKEAVDLALRHVDVATRLVQFFVVASVAVGGWVVTSEDLRLSAQFGPDRIVWALLYTLLSLPIWLALLDLQARINACYGHARRFLDGQAQVLVRDFEPRLVRYGFPVFVLFVDLIILAL